MMCYKQKRNGAPVSSSSPLFNFKFNRYYYLKFVFMTSQGRSLLLPEIIRFDNVSDVDGTREMFLKDFEYWLDGSPCCSTHIDDDCKSLFFNVVTGKKKKEKWF